MLFHTTKDPRAWRLRFALWPTRVGYQGDVVIWTWLRRYEKRASAYGTFERRLPDTAIMPIEFRYAL